MPEATGWNDYQEQAADVFRSMGLEAETNVRIQGVRTSHDIDVLVKSQHAGFQLTWLVECKHWSSSVSKVHVLALREIVSDTGADRGILLCEAGFQSGAIEAANLTNVRVTSLENLKFTGGSDISAMRLRDLYDRVERARTHYWDIPKIDRIARGLRPHPGGSGYSVAHNLNACHDLIVGAFRGSYPFRPDSIATVSAFGSDREFASAEEVIAIVTPLIDEVEGRMAAKGPEA